MKTKLIKIDPENIDLQKLKEAANALRKGEIVAIPTETVYGLGADALNPGAVEKIFKAKGRPSDNPLIVHIADREWVDRLTRSIPEKALVLMDKLWPGPLTLVMRKSSIIPGIITAGLDTVAIRMPEHPVARELIRLAGVPVAAPSANVSGRPSTTTAQHVIDDLEGKIHMVVDSGSSRVGLESTVLDITVEPPVLLRPGGITPGQLEELIGPIEIDRTILAKTSLENTPKAPGMKYTHYSPDAQVVIIRGSDMKKQVEKITQLAKEHREAGRSVGICSTDQTTKSYSDFFALSMGDRSNPETIAARLFALLREFDGRGVDVIIAEAVEEHEVGLAIMNRLIKAAGYDIIEV